MVYHSWDCRVPATLRSQRERSSVFITFLEQNDKEPNLGGRFIRQISGDWCKISRLWHKDLSTPFLFPKCYLMYSCSVQVLRVRLMGELKYHPTRHFFVKSRSMLNKHISLVSLFYFMWYLRPILSLTWVKTKFPILVLMSTNYNSHYSFLPLVLWGHSFLMKRRQLLWL